MSGNCTGLIERKVAEVDVKKWASLVVNLVICCWHEKGVREGLQGVGLKMPMIILMFDDWSETEGNHHLLTKIASSFKGLWIGITVGKMKISALPLVLAMSSVHYIKTKDNRCFVTALRQAVGGSVEVMQSCGKQPHR